MEGKMQEKGDLEGKVVLVTGASSGLGREFCVQLAKQGCHVLAAARRTDLLQSLLYQIQGNHGNAFLLQMDVSQNEIEIDARVNEAWAIFGRIDVLVNNAGYRGPVRSPLEWEEGEWNKVMATNLRGAWLVSKSVGKRMVAAKLQGSIINISSTAGLERTLLPGALAYSVSKAALNQLTKVMALELGKHNIRVNAIAAGIFKSEMTDKLLDQEWVHQAAKRMTPMQRWGNADPDLTSLLFILASDSSSYITGCIFIMDGGQSIPGIPIWSSL